MFRKYVVMPILVLGTIAGGYLLYEFPFNDLLGPSASKTTPDPIPQPALKEENNKSAAENEPQKDIQNTLAEARPGKKESALLDAPIIAQLPELRNGCEVVSLTMLLQFYGIEKNKMELSKELIRDPTEKKESPDRKILYWGNPNTGFVGDVTGKKMGYGIYNGPLFKLLEKYIPSAVNLTGQSFDEIERSVSEGRPVVVWTTVSFVKPREDQWVTWDSPQGEVRATFQEHAVLVVGYDKDHVYVNDPLSGKKQLKLEKSSFLPSWEALGKQALTYTAAQLENGPNT